MFKQDPESSEAMTTLTQGHRTAFALLAAGAILPMFLLGVIRPVYWGVAFQMACLTGLSYLRWRSPAFGGSLWVMAAAGLACIVSLAAAITA